MGADQAAGTERATGGERLVVGLVRGLHGLRGAVRVEVLTDDASRYALGSVLHAEGANDPLTVVWRREDAPGILVRFREVTSRDAAEGLRDRYLEARAAPDALPEGTYYWHELAGNEVMTTAGEHLGRVEDVFRAGESEVFVVRGGRRGEILVPGVQDVVREFEPRAGRIVVDADALGLDDVTPRRPRGRRSSKQGPRSEGSAGESGKSGEHRE